jgi:hypothetical protein
MCDVLSMLSLTPQRRGDQKAVVERGGKKREGQFSVKTNKVLQKL